MPTSNVPEPLYHRLLGSPRVKTALVGLLVAVGGVIVPTLPGEATEKIATGVITFLIGLFLRAPGDTARGE